MIKKLKTIVTCVLLLCVVGLGAQPLKQDAAVRTGKLKNGMTYYIRHNAKEPGLADFYIAQRVGSILEEPRQRGLAHFLEHMASSFCRENASTARRRQKMLSKSQSNPKAQTFMLWE